MISDIKIIEIFCKVDDFIQKYSTTIEKYILAHPKKRKRKSKLSLSEVITILILFQLSDYKTFKHFYISHVNQYMQDYFSDLVSYNRMVELVSSAMMPMVIFFQHHGLRNATGISFVDSTPIRVTHNRRIHSHKIFKGLAARGHTSVGWFYGFKLHIVTNDKGEILTFMLTPGNVDDRKPLKNEAFTRKIFGKIFGDKGYISKELFISLFEKGIHLITKLRKNSKEKTLTPLDDAIMLRKRAIIETIFDQLKNIFQIEHSRHRSVRNFITNLASALLAYSFIDKKPSIKRNFVDTKQLILPL